MGQLLQPLILAGPTAVGKSAVALRVAELLDGEVISVDSMQVYRGLDIGTAKPSVAERQRVPHHLIDVVDLAEAFDAARFVQLARPALDEIQRPPRGARVGAMFDLGLVPETEKLLTRGLGQNRRAMQARGYRQAVEYLRGQRSLADTVALVKLRTRQFAKRQLTWFRRQA